MHGKLYLVSTPIGNLEDITQRAVNVLKEVDLIACEDTRTTKKLLSKYSIKNDLISYHEHNELERSKGLIEILKDGKNIAIVSDAGTPCICDPGYKIVGLSIENGIDVIPIPGPSAIISALIVSGLSTDSFTFFGFFPKTKKKGKELLQNIKTFPQTTVLYESPKRVLKTLELILEELGSRKASVSREITKLYEETIRGNISDVIVELNKRDQIKGEMVIVIEGAAFDGEKIVNDIDTLKEKLQILHKEKVSLKSAVGIFSDIYEIPKNIIYETALKIWNK